MDASSLAASALAIANETSQSAAVQELLQERERLAMDREALLSFVCERHYIRAPASAVSARPETTIWSWRDAFEHRTAVLDERREEVRYQAIVLRENLDNVVGDMDFMLSAPLIQLSELRTGPAVATRVRSRLGGNGGRSRSPRR